MEYPHFKRKRNEVAEEIQQGFAIKPKIGVYIALAVLATLHYFFTFSWFLYPALGFLGYAVFKLISCGCWKSQLRTVAGVFILLLATGVLWRPLLSLSVAILTFEMFI